MNVFRTAFRIFLLAALGLSLPACEKLLAPTPDGQPSAETFYTNYYGALTGVNGCYNALGRVYSTNGDNGGDFWLVDALSDDATNAGSSSGGIDSQQWEDLALIPSNRQVETIWTNLYRGIYRCNLQISRWESVYASEVGNRKILVRQFAGEAYFLRALLYYQLVQAFGGVPLVTAPDSQTDQLKVPRSTPEQVYAQLIADAAKAAELLPVQHPNPALNGSTTGISGGTEVGRATVGAVQALLASAYLTRNELDKALEQITNLKTNGKSVPYSLVPNYVSNFPVRGGVENNVESIFEIQYAAQVGSSSDVGLRLDLPALSGANGYNRPTDVNDFVRPISGGGIRQAFSTADARLPVSINYAATPLQPRAYKFIPDVLAERSVSGINWPVFRYAEILLAEAEIRNAKNDQDGALNAVDQIRSRAKLPTLRSLNVTDPTALRDSIRLERRRELCFEAKRWFDLNRWGITVATMTQHGRPMQDFMKLLPIPQNEFSRNPLLVQNPGYSK